MWNLRTSEILREGGRNVRKKRAEGLGRGGGGEPLKYHMWRLIANHFGEVSFFFHLESSLAPWTPFLHGRCSRRVPGKPSELRCSSPHMGCLRDLTPHRAPRAGSRCCCNSRLGGPPAGGEPSHLSFLSSPLLIAALGSLQSVVDENIILLCLVPASPCPRHWSSRGDAALWFGADR